MKKEEQFIKLRSEGIPIDLIAKELKTDISKLVQWNERFSKEISNLQFIELQNSIYELTSNKKDRIEALIKKLNEVNDHISNFDVSLLSMKEVLMLKDQLKKELNEEKRGIIYKTDMQQEIDYGLIEEVYYKLD